MLTHNYEIYTVHTGTHGAALARHFERKLARVEAVFNNAVLLAAVAATLKAVVLTPRGAVRVHLPIIAHAT